MQMTASKLVMLGWCFAVAIVSICAVLVLVPGAAPDWGLPLFFWTLVGLLLVVATAAAVGLPREKAGPWRTLLITLFACHLYYNPVTRDNLFFRLIDFLPRSWQPLSAMIRRHAWDASVSRMLVYLGIAGAAVSIALLIAPRESSKLAQGFRFRLSHLFLFSTFVALTCVVLRSGSPLAHDVVAFTNLALRLIAAIGIGARWGNRSLMWGFLFGNLTWEGLVDHWQLAAEWNEWLPHSLLQDRSDLPFGSQYQLVKALLPIYAGILTGVLAALFYQRAEPPPVNKKGHAEA